jgi:hypothetical protein
MITKGTHQIPFEYQREKMPVDVLERGCKVPSNYTKRKCPSFYARVHPILPNLL